MKILIKIAKYLSNILIGILVIFCIYAVICTAFLKHKYINVFGHTFFVVASGSMTGTIDINDLVIVKITDEFEANDIITFMKDDYFVTHRVISSQGDEIITKGDANNIEDDPISLEHVVGKVTFILPFSSILQTFGAIILVTIIIVVFNFEKIFKKYIFNKTIDNSVIRDYTSSNDDESIYSDIALQILTTIKSRGQLNNNELLDDVWLKRLRYVAKFAELVKLENLNTLYQLVNGYYIDESKMYNHSLSPQLIKKLYEESLNSHIILMLNAIMYRDEDIFAVLFISFRFKINCELDIKK